MVLTLLWLTPQAAGLLCLAAPSRIWWERVNLASAAALVALAIKTAFDVLAQGPVSALGGFLRADALSALVIGLTAFVSLVSAIYAVGYLRADAEAGKIKEAQLRRYYVLTPLFISSMILVPLADNLGVMWVAIESTTLASVLLVTFYNLKTSFEAGWKYIIIGSVGISLALFGTVMIYYSYYSSVGALDPEAHGGMNWSLLAGMADKLDPKAMRLGFLMVLLGYGTKAGLAPMHTWKPDAYAEAPAPTAALLGAAFVNCAVYGIIRVDILAEKCLGHEFPGRLLGGFGVASILVAAPFILTQRNFRRLLAYSSIDHAGIMVAALGFGGPLGALGAALHMLFHGVTKPLLFFCAGNVQQKFSTPYLWKVRGVIRTLPWTGGFFLLGTLAVTGMPPFGIFQSEFTTLSAALAAGRAGAAFLFLAGVVTIFAGFLVHMAKMNLGIPRDDAPAPGSEGRWKLAAMLVVVAGIILLSVHLPAPLSNLLGEAARIIGGNL